VARRIYRAPNGDEVEIMGQGGHWDVTEGWIFRNPRSGHWQTGNMLSRDRGQRHRALAGGPDISQRGYYIIRYRIDGRDYYEKEYHPRGVRNAAQMLGRYTPPQPGQRDTGRPTRRRT